MHTCDTWMFKCFLCAATNGVQDTEAEPNPSTNSSADHLQIVDEEPTHIPPPKKSNAAHSTHIPHPPKSRIRKRL